MDEYREQLRQQYQETCGASVIALGDILDALAKLRFEGESEVVSQNFDGSKFTMRYGRGVIGTAEDHIREAITDLRCYRDGEPRKRSFAQVAIVERREGEVIARCQHRSHGVYRPAPGLTRSEHGCFACELVLPAGSKIWRATECKHTICDACATGVTALTKTTPELR